MGVADELERLQQLHNSGALTDEEFAQAKAAILAGESAGSQSKSTGATCYKCSAGPSSVCQLCGSMFCGQHGGERLVWVDSTGGKHGALNTLTRRVICDDCTPDPAMMKRRMTFLVILAIVVLGGILFVSMCILLSFLWF
jgi:hypothetical protein